MEINIKDIKKERINAAINNLEKFLGDKCSTFGPGLETDLRIVLGFVKECKINIREKNSRLNEYARDIDNLEKSMVLLKEAYEEAKAGWEQTQELLNELSDF